MSLKDESLIKPYSFAQGASWAAIIALLTNEKVAAAAVALGISHYVSDRLSKSKPHNGYKLAGLLTAAFVCTTAILTREKPEEPGPNSEPYHQSQIL